MSDYLEVSLGGETYQISKLTLNDLRKFENRVRSERLRLALDVLPPSEDRAKVIAEILGGEVDVTTEMGQMGGIVYLIWLGIHHNQKDVKFEALADRLKLTDVRVLQTLIDKLAFDSGAGEEDGENPPGEGSNQAGEQ